MASYNKYCCDRKCFKLPSESVDGLACRKCKSFGNCFCSCTTHIENIKYCCEYKCHEYNLDENNMIDCKRCLSGRYEFCKCKCTSYMKDKVFCCENKCTIDKISPYCIKNFFIFQNRYVVR